MPTGGPGTVQRAQASGNVTPRVPHSGDVGEGLSDSDSTATETESDSPGHRARALRHQWGSQASLASMGSAGPPPSVETGGRYSRDIPDLQHRPLGAVYGNGSRS